MLADLKKQCNILDREHPVCEKEVEVLKLCTQTCGIFWHKNIDMSRCSDHRAQRGIFCEK